MINLKYLKSNKDECTSALVSKGYDASNLIRLLELDAVVRELELERTGLQARANEISKAIALGDNPGGLLEEGLSIKLRLSKLGPQERVVKAELEEYLLAIPNLPDSTTPVGLSESDNVELRRWGDTTTSAPILPHWELAEGLGILDFERSTKIAQSRFVTLKGLGAALERALISFMLDYHTSNGYLEISPPYLVNSASLTASGQLPKFSDDSFKCDREDLWLLPTAEVAINSLHRDEVMDSTTLPLNYCAYTPCFRREAGSYGRDTRGLIRLHQFNKVEMFKVVEPDSSSEEHELLVASAEAILQALELPYRVMLLCTYDLGFSAARTYDIEVWMPSQGKYREISSCSNCTDFQSRRSNMRVRDKSKKGTYLPHTLNGSGLAIGRTMAAILENNQLPSGDVVIPKVLLPYMGRSLITK